MVLYLLAVLFLALMWYAATTATSEGFAVAAVAPSALLLGDSVFDNAKYVDPGDSIADLLPTAAVLARDNARISDLYRQIPAAADSHVPIFVSIGGNNLLDNPKSVDDTFAAWKTAVATVATTSGTVFVCDLYYPPMRRAEHPLIRDWNARVAASGYRVLALSRVLTAPDDFAAEVEPSASGARKIAAEIRSLMG